jgi:SAM-dependent methyltransferase
VKVGGEAIAAGKRCFPGLRARLRPFVLAIRRLPLHFASVERRFARIYHRNEWCGEESLSGPGSSLAATGAIREALPALLSRLGCRVLLDVPCGDFHWLSAVPLDLDRYFGVDIVSRLITENGSRHGGDNRQFLRLDMRSDPLPGADLILCRDGLVHLSDRDVARTLTNFRQSGARYLLTTSFPRQRHNPPIATGEWRPLNLELPPFHLPSPLAVVADGAGTVEPYTDKVLALWSLE